jgi:hypothetical protein
MMNLVWFILRAQKSLTLSVAFIFTFIFTFFDLFEEGVDDITKFVLERPLLICVKLLTVSIFKPNLFVALR